MSYTPTTWATGDVITATKLNNMEQGIASAGGGGPIVVDVSESGVLSKTWQEISDAGMSFRRDEESNGTFRLTPMELIGGSPGDYFVEYSDSTSFVASSATDYPVFEE